MPLEIPPISSKNIEVFNAYKNDLLGSDIVLLLLSISSFKDRTFMQKEVFLAWKELFENISADLNFFPYNYGPYSRILDDIVDYLERKQYLSTKYVDTKKQDHPRKKFTITHEGKGYLQNKIKSFSIDREKLEEVKAKWDEYNSDGIKKLVYRKYPKYASRTKRPDLKWS